MDGFLSKNRFKSTQKPNLLQESESKESVERIERYWAERPQILQ